MRTLFFFVLMFVQAIAYAQWTSSGDNFTTGKLAVGTNAASTHTLQVGAPSTTMPSLAIGERFKDTGGTSRLMFWGGQGANADGFFVDYKKTSTEDRLVFTDGAGREAMTWLYGGSVGMGVSNPTNTFHIGNTSGTQPSLGIGVLNTNTGGTSQLNFYAGTTTVGNVFSVLYKRVSTPANEDRLIFMDGGNVECMTILNGGKIGIGTSTPGSFKLAVEGKIGAREINVTTTNPFPDYVFNDDYKLPSLETIKRYIKENHHLPEVPSAADVKANGVDLGDMNTLLLKKIEELTLYLIEKDSEIKALRRDVEALKEKK